MPAVIDAATWDKAERQRHSARQVRGKVHSWLLQGICVCGICGHKLGCDKKNGANPRYYFCRGRHKVLHADGSPTCTLPYIRADQLEFMVWNKLKHVFADSETMKQYVDKALGELEQRKTQMGEGFLDIEKGMVEVKKKEERLGIAYAAGTMTENTYKTQLNQLKKQESDLIQRQHNLDPAEVIEITKLSGRITAVKELLSKGKIRLTDLGFFAADGDKYVPLGFNPWPETDGKMAVGQPAEMETVYQDKEIGLVGKSNIPPGFSNPDVPAHEKGERVMMNWRELLRFLNIKATIYPDHKEIRGTIPTQFIENSVPANGAGSPITCSVEN